MTIEIIGDFDRNQLYCTGSLTKLLTSFVSLSFLSEHYNLSDIIDDKNFLDNFCLNLEAKKFLHLFQKKLGGKFSLHDILSYYAGLPYTFDAAPDEIERTDEGYPFKHHSILDETIFLERCHNQITPVYPPQSKFHYSELSIIFLGYLLEKVSGISMEDLYQKYLLNVFSLKNSYFSRIRMPNVLIRDLSPHYDYPSIAILDHGYFCYSNGFYTTLNDMSMLLEQLISHPIFHFMTDMKYVRAASNRLMNGITVEIRLAKDDLIYGYEGLSFSGCNLWAYSTKLKKGYLTFHESEEKVYEIIYDQAMNYKNFDPVPKNSQIIYEKFIKNYKEIIESKNIPDEFQGNYQRVNINDTTLPNIFSMGENYMIIRNPDEIKYDILYIDNNYRVKGKDHIHGAKVGFYTSKKGNRYMSYDGTLYLSNSGKR